MLDIPSVIKVLMNERACVVRNIDGCDRNCASCDLVLEDHIILDAYDTAINVLNAELDTDDDLK